jgi:CDP-diacylglycerol pyrophosphatase
MGRVLLYWRTIKRRHAVTPRTSSHFLLACAIAGFHVTAAWAGPRNHTEKSTDAPIDSKQPAGTSALRQIVQQQCVPNWLQHHDPAPCSRVVLIEQKSSSAGYAVIADVAGGAHYLLVPTQTLTPNDSVTLLDPATQNFFAAAWHSRDELSKLLGHPVPRSAVGVAVGIPQLQGQDQYHIDIGCLSPEVFRTLHSQFGSLTETWSSLNVSGSSFQAMRIMAEGLDGTNLYESLGKLNPGARDHLANYTLIAAGIEFAGAPGFVVLAGTGLSGEFLLDSTCVVGGGIG